MLKLIFLRSVSRSIQSNSHICFAVILSLFFYNLLCYSSSVTTNNVCQLPDIPIVHKRFSPTNPHFVELFLAQMQFFEDAIHSREKPRKSAIFEVLESTATGLHGQQFPGPNPVRQCAKTKSSIRARPGPFVFSWFTARLVQK